MRENTGHGKPVFSLILCSEKATYGKLKLGLYLAIMFKQLVLFNMLFTTKSAKDGILSAGIFPQVDSESNSELS